MASRILTEGVFGGLSEAAWLFTFETLGGRVFVGEAGLEVAAFVFRDAVDGILRAAGVLGLEAPFDAVEVPTRAAEETVLFRAVGVLIMALRTRGLDGVVGVGAGVAFGAVRADEGWGMRDMGGEKERDSCEQVQEFMVRVT
jgi:hypothetical protein